MKTIDYLLNKILASGKEEAVIWNNYCYSYDALYKRINEYFLQLNECGVQKGEVIILQSDYTFSSIALLVALFKLKSIVVFYSLDLKTDDQAYLDVTRPQWKIFFNQEDKIQLLKTNIHCFDHPYWDNLRSQGHAGLVLFSSGSTGHRKAIVHDVDKLFSSFLTPKKITRVIGFLLFDHIGGINTLFYSFFNGGCFIILKNRLTQTVCEAIETYRANALTTTPTFLNLLMLSESYKKHDLSSLRYINFSTERMNESVYMRLKEIFPKVGFSQSYGSSEAGVLPIHSAATNPLWLKINSEHCAYRVREGMLEVKSPSSMLGYLNAPNPFTEDGWYKTGDKVEIRDEQLKILGRRSEIINVGGEKVYPAEIEEVLESMPGVLQALVWGEAHPMIGKMIVASVFLDRSTERVNFKIQLNLFCQNRLTPLKIPRKIFFSETPLHGTRFKKIRNQREHHVTYDQREVS